MSTRERSSGGARSTSLNNGPEVNTEKHTHSDKGTLVSTVNNHFTYTGRIATHSGRAGVPSTYIEIEVTDPVSTSVQPGCLATVVVQGEPPSERIYNLDEPEQPAWADAPAVIASYPDGSGVSLRGVCANDGGGAWETDAGVIHWTELRDVTPLYPR